MAFVSKAVVRVTVSMEDQAKPTSTHFYIGAVEGVLPAVTDIDDAISTAMGHFIATSDCRVNGYEVSYIYVNDTIGAFGDAPDRERKAVLQYNTTPGNFPTIITIPGAKYDMFAPDGETVIRDPADDQSFTTNPLAADLNALNTLFLNGITVGLVTYPVTDRRGDDINALLDAYKNHRANARG